MNGPGCKTCPVRNCDTLQYRGSRFAALRDQHGLDDPGNTQTQPTLSPKYLIIPLVDWEQFHKELTSNLEPHDHYDTGYRDAADRIDDWLETHKCAEPPRTDCGHWEFINDYESRCTNCGETSWIDHAEEHRFCPKCGAQMTDKNH